MKTKLLFGLCLILHLSYFILSAHAQGTTFTYQGRLNDGVTPANGVYDLRFAVYDASASGNQAGNSVTNFAIGVNNGLFVVTLNFGGVFTGTNYWLDVNVRTNGAVAFTALAPRQPITPTPYAIFANTASNVSGTLADVRLSANVALLNRNGQQFTGDNYFGSNLGIGTVSPQAQLNVNGTARFEASTPAYNEGLTLNLPTDMPGGGYGGIHFHNAVRSGAFGSGTIKWGMFYNYTPEGGVTGKGFSIVQNNANTRLYVSTNGNVGIGNNNPLYKLDVNGDVNLPATATIYSAGNLLLRADANFNFFAGQYAGNLTLSGFDNTGIGEATLVNDTSGYLNTAVGATALYLNTSGANNTAVGTGSLYYNTNGNFNTAIGVSSLGNNLAGNNNTASGYSALAHNSFGNDNTADGYQALFSNTGGNHNTANGTFALFSNTIGSFNTAIGYQALYSNTNSSFNTAVGTQALYSNTTGGGNTAIGGAALYSNVSGIYNTASGVEALASNTSGSGNTATGAGTLNSNTTGSDNTANGFGVLAYNTIGSNNTAIGYVSLRFNTTGFNNTASGEESLFDNLTGVNNVANGYQALYSNTNGSANTANGTQSLYSNTNGKENTATGFGALYANTTGSENTANGIAALYSNSTGGDDTATGAGALFSNLTGSENVANGYQSLYSNASGTQNTAAGSQALYSNTSGVNNTADGFEALYSNTTGFINTADGTLALFSNTTGSENTAVGQQALYFNTSGGLNIALGYQAGLTITTGTNNIDIGNVGGGNDTNLIRIGSSQAKTFIAGIFNATVSGSAVVVNSSGQLGVAPSSQRFKQNVQTMGDTSDVLLALNPVTFQYKSDIDPQGLAQFGLIAEQVEKVDPDLVVHDQEHGIYTVRYEAVNAMLLNEFLKEHRKVEAQNATLEALRRKVDSQNVARAELQRKDAALEKRLEALESILRDQKPSPPTAVRKL